MAEVRRPVPPEEARRLAGRYADGAGETLDLQVEEGQLVARDQDRAYPVRVREEGHLEILGHPALLPLPATPLERVPQDPSQPQVAVRLLWSLLWRVTP